MINDLLSYRTVTSLIFSQKIILNGKKSKRDYYSFWYDAYVNSTKYGIDDPNKLKKYQNGRELTTEAPTGCFRTPYLERT